MSWRLVGAVILLGLLGGCGGGSGGSDGGGSQGPGYRWLAGSGDQPPTVAEENRQRGTRSWRLPGGRGRGHLDAYVSEQDVRPGERELVYVSAPGARSVTARIYRMGWYGGTGGRLVLTSARLAVRRQPPCRHQPRTGLTECHWLPTLSLSVPRGLASGVYLIKLVSDRGAERYAMFVLEAAHPAPLLAQLPTATYEAYNYWGGDSLYPGGTRRVAATGSAQGVEVSYDRPYDSVTGAGQYFRGDAAMVSFLERYGYPVSYITSTGSDRLADPAGGARALLDMGHSEYWSARAERAFARARDRGVNLVFLSSDTLAWRVRFEPATPASSEAGRSDHVIVGYKEHASSDPNRSLTSGAFPGFGAALTGSAYLGCITPRVARPGPPTYRYYAWTPAPGLKPAWLFAHTGITSSTRIAGISGYEVDQRTAASPKSTTLVGQGSVTCMPPAPGEPVPGPQEHFAQTTLLTAPSGALVFSSGTLGWELGLAPLPDVSPDAPRRPSPQLVALTRNLLDRVLASGGPSRSPSG